jgi:multisubunit Na+/H+ antiporter MnhG subunit
MLILPIFYLSSSKNQIIARLSKSVLCGFGIIILGLIALFAGLELFLSVGQWLLPTIAAGLWIVCLLIIWKPFDFKVRQAIVTCLMVGMILSAVGTVGVKLYQDSIPTVQEETGNVTMPGTH